MNKKKLGLILVGLLSITQLNKSSALAATVARTSGSSHTFRNILAGLTAMIGAGIGKIYSDDPKAATDKFSAAQDALKTAFSNAVSTSSDSAAEARIDALTTIVEQATTTNTGKNILAGTATVAGIAGLIVLGQKGYLTRPVAKAKAALKQTADFTIAIANGAIALGQQAWTNKKEVGKALAVTGTILALNHYLRGNDSVIGHYQQHGGLGIFPSMVAQCTATIKYGINMFRPVSA